MKKIELNLKLRAIEILSNPRYRALGEDKIFFNKEEQNEVLTDFLMECVGVAEDIKKARGTLRD